jgi:hypothetical protein
MNTPIVRKIALNALFLPLTTERLVGTFTIRNTSTGNAVLLCDDGITELPMDRSQQFTLEGVDLSKIHAKGNLGDFLMVIGATRTV